MDHDPIQAELTLLANFARLTRPRLQRVIRKLNQGDLTQAEQLAALSTCVESLALLLDAGERLAEKSRPRASTPRLRIA